MNEGMDGAPVSCQEQKQFVVKQRLLQLVPTYDYLYSVTHVLILGTE